MICPRCGSQKLRYANGSTTNVVCQRCGAEIHIQTSKKKKFPVWVWIVISMVCLYAIGSNATSETGKVVSADKQSVISSSDDSAEHIESTMQQPEPQYKLSTGEVLDVIENVRDGMQVLIIKAKIQSLFSNKQTIDQNYHNVCGLITEQGCDRFDEIQYWALADMRDGSEQKVIAFTLNKETIQGVKDESILPITIEPYLSDLWIHPSLLDGSAETTETAGKATTTVTTTTGQDNTANDNVTAPDRLSDNVGNIGNTYTTAPYEKLADGNVWVDDTGKCYHVNQNCSHMDNPYQVTKDEALAMGRRACKKCCK